MKTISSKVWCALFMLCAAAMAVAPGFDAKQPQATKRSAEAKPANVEMLLTLKVPASSPIFSRVPIATVNDDVVRMDELTKALASSHESRQPGAAHAGKINYTRILDRLINIRLITQEAANIGIDEMPEFKSETEANARKTLAALVMKEITRDVKSDPLEVEKRFKDMVGEWKIKSLLFEKEADAKAMSDAIKAGKSFDELAKKALNDKKAKGGEQGEYLKPKDLLPQIASAASVLEPGAVTPVIKLASGKNTGFALLKLEDKRYPENPAARQRAEQGVLADKKNEALTKYRQTLYATQVTINEKLVNKVEYDSQPNIQKLLSDTRVVAEFKDGKTITVAALTKALQEKFFHGLEQAAKDKMVDKAKRDVLNKVIDDQLIGNEALKKGIDKSDEYQDGIKEFKFTTLFGMFIDKVIVPDLKVPEGAMRAYYQDHKKEYVDPEMIKMISLTFGNKRDAESALQKLKKGADVNWVRANAEGLVADADEGGGPTKGMLILTTKDLPRDVARSVAGARAGEARLSPGPEGRFSVLVIQEVVPARQQPYEEVRKEIWKKVFDVTLSKTLEDWFRKLRAAADVKVYLSGMGK